MKKKGDPIDGVLLFDKPEGLSSNAAMQIVRRLANAPVSYTHLTLPTIA